MPFPGTRGRGDLPWDDPSFMGTCARMSARTRGPALGCPKFHRDVRTWGSSPGCPQCHRDMATCPGTWGDCSPWGQQPHGGWLCHPGQWDRAPNAPKGAPRAVAGSRAEQRKKSKNGEREAGARSPPCPLPGDDRQLSGCHSQWNQHVNAPQLFSTSLARCRRLSPSSTPGRG